MDKPSEVTTKTLFETLRPLCIRVAQSPSSSTISELHYKIVSIDDDDKKCLENAKLTPLLDYLCIPVMMALKKQNL